MKLNMEMMFMDIHEIPFGVTKWNAIASTEHKGETGVARWRTCVFGNIEYEWLSTQQVIWPTIGVRRVTSYCA